MAEDRNLERTAQQLQQRVVFLQRLGLGLDVLLGGVLAALLATVLRALLGWSVPLLVVYGCLPSSLWVFSSGWHGVSAVPRWIPWSALIVPLASMPL